MRKAITIKIPEPCHEDWNLMTVEEKGRHCNVCVKTVHDFTSFTNRQLISTIKNDHNLCGRFRKEQLNTELVLQKKERNSYLSLLASGLFAFITLGTQEIHAQGEVKIEKIDSLNRNMIKGKVATSVLDSIIIKGVVQDKDSIPLPGATIVIKGTATGTQTDFDGSFAIKAKKNDILSISYIDYESLEVKPQKNIIIQLKESEAFLGEVVIGMPGYSYKRQLRKEKRQEHRALIRSGKSERTAVGKFLFKITNIFRKKE